MLIDLIRENRTCRSYDRSCPVNHDDLLRFVEHARQSAAGLNMQPMKYYLVTDPEEAAIINSHTKLGAHLTIPLPPEGMEPPAYILICQDLNVSTNLNFFRIDVGIDAQSISLAATEDGLACCMIGNYNEAKLREDLGISDQFYIQLVIAVGKPAEIRKLVDAEEGTSLHYYREGGVHYVPKRKLDEIIINK